MSDPSPSSAALATHLLRTLGTIDEAISFAHRHKLRVPRAVSRARAEIDQAIWQLRNERPRPAVHGANSIDRRRGPLVDVPPIADRWRHLGQGDVSVADIQRETGEREGDR